MMIGQTRLESCKRCKASFNLKFVLHNIRDKRGASAHKNKANGTRLPSLYEFVPHMFFCSAGAMHDIAWVALQSQQFKNHNCKYALTNFHIYLPTCLYTQFFFHVNVNSLDRPCAYISCFASGRQAGCPMPCLRWDCRMAHKTHAFQLTLELESDWPVSF